MDNTLNILKSQGLLGVIVVMSKISKIAARIVYGLLAASVFMLPFALAGLWQWFWLCVGILILTAGFEIYSKVKHDYSISKAFWIWRDKHPKAAFVILAVISLGWAFLIFHLGFG